MINRFVIIVAGGKGLRMGADIPKQFLNIHDKPILIHTLDKFAEALPEPIFILVLAESEIDRWKKLAKGTAYENIQIAKGGENRFDSVKAGLNLINEGGIVGIHDAVRPLVSIETIRNAYDVAAFNGLAIPVIPLKESIRKVDTNPSQAVDRDEYRIVQTPQCFHVDYIKGAYQQSYSKSFTDDATVTEALAGQVRPEHLIEGNQENIKITTKEDLILAEALLAPSEKS